MGWIRIFLSSFLAIILSQLVCFVWDPNLKVALQTLGNWEKHPTFLPLFLNIPTLDIPDAGVQNEMRAQRKKSVSMFPNDSFC